MVTTKCMGVTPFITWQWYNHNYTRFSPIKVLDPGCKCFYRLYASDYLLCGSFFRVANGVDTLYFCCLDTIELVLCAMVSDILELFWFKLCWSCGNTTAVDSLLISPTIDQMVSLMAVGTSDTFTVAGCNKASIYRLFTTDKKPRQI